MAALCHRNFVCLLTLTNAAYTNRAEHSRTSHPDIAVCSEERCHVFFFYAYFSCIFGVTGIFFLAFRNSYPGRHIAYPSSNMIYGLYLSICFGMKVSVKNLKYKCNTSGGLLGSATC